MSWTHDERLVRRFAAVSAVASLFVCVVGLTSLAGWLFQVEWIRSWLPGAPPVRLIPAVCYTLLGISLVVLRRDDGRHVAPALLLAVRGVCVAVLVAGVIGLIEHGFGWDSGLSSWIARINPGAVRGDVRTGIASYITSINLFLLSVSMLMLHWRHRRGDPIAQIPATLAGISSCFALLNYMLRMFVPAADISFLSAVACAALSAGVLCARPRLLLGGMLVGVGAGPRWLRRLLPVSVFVLGLFCAVLAEPMLSRARIDWVEAVGLAIVAALLLVGLVVWFASQIQRIEGQNERVLAALCLKPEQLDRLMEEYEDDPDDATARRWSKGGVALGILLTCLGFFFSWRVMQQASQGEQWVAHTYIVMETIDKVLDRLNEIETADRGFAATGDEHFTDALNQSRSGLYREMGQLSERTQDNRIQRILIEELRPQVERKLEVVDQILNARRQKGRLPDPALMLTGQKRMEYVRQTISAMQLIEMQLLEERKLRAENSRRQVKTVVLVSTLLGVTMLVLAGLVTVREINRGAQTRGQIRTANTMLERRVESRSAELKESEERLRLFVEHAPAALAMFDRQMNYLVASRRWMEDFGLGGADLQGCSHYEVFPDIPERWKAIHQRGIAGEILRSDEDCFERADGSEQWLKWEIHPWREATGEIGGIVIFSEDVTARKNTEEELRQHRARLDAALSSMTDAVFLVNAEGKFLHANEGFLNYYRISNWSECPERILDFGKFYEVSLGESNVVTDSSNWPAFRALQGEIASDAEYTIHRLVTGERWVGSYSYSPVRDKQGEIIGAVVVARDITKRKADERELQRLNGELELRVEERTAQLKAAVNELEAFTYSVSHDLRAPLRHISGYSKMLAEDFSSALPEEGRRFVERIMDGSRRMGLLIDDLLNLGRVGRQELRLQTTGLRTLIDEVIVELQSDCEGRSVEWEIGQLPFWDCDPGLTKQVLQNLISNAVKFTRTREPARIEIGLTEAGGAIFVRDNGVGFSMKYADKLFGVFQRLHRQEDFEGTGVGLATTLRIVHKHGGRIWAEAELDKGATFFFTLTSEEPTYEAAGLTRGVHE